MTLNPALDYHANKGVLPGFVQPAQILLTALDVLVPAIDMTPSECAAEYRYYDGVKYDPDLTPYMGEPSDMTVSRRYKAVIFAGTVQSGKTMGLVENPILHRMICEPCDVHVTQMDKVSAGLYSKGKIDKMLRDCPELRDRLIAPPGSLGNVHEKIFKGNGMLTIGWPVVSHLSSRSIPLVITTDRDRISDDIDGEGDILILQLARNVSFLSRGMSVVEGSPGRDIEDETWSPSTIHEAPPCSGILGYYNSGTRARYYWKCPHCRRKFEAEYHHFKFDKEGSNLERGKSAYLVCPKKNCGGIIEASEKYHLNLAKNGAGWLHESADGKRAVPLGHKDIRQAEYVSYWQKGPVAALQAWSDIVTAMLDAEQDFERTGAEQKLKTTTNTKLGLPFLSKAREASLEISGTSLSERAEFRTLGIAPKKAAFIIIAIDVQPSRFVVSVTAFGEGLEHWLVDRFDLAMPPPDAPGADRRGMQTNLYLEDWKVLEELHERIIPVDGENYGLKPVAIIIDSNGATGTTERAYKFWRTKRRKRQNHIYHLYKGVGGWDKPRAKHRAPENQLGKKRVNKGSVKIVFTATNRIKDEVIASLAREEAGPLTMHLPESLPKNIFDEFCAERKGKDGWEKKPGHTRNESLDLAVMTKAVMIVKNGEKINWDRPPPWALASAENKLAVIINSDGEPSGTKPTRKSGGASLAAARSGFIKK